MCHGKLDALFGKVAPDAGKGGIAVLACREANGSRSATRDLTGLDVAEQSVLLGILDEMCENDAVHVLYAAVLHEVAAAADGTGITVEESERLFGGGSFTNNVPNSDRLLVSHGGAVLPCPEVNGRVLGKASPVSFAIVDGLAYGAGMKTADEVERNGELAIDEWRELDTTIRG